MLKLMTTAAVLIALAAPAMAGSIPAQFKGDWCVVPDSGSEKLALYNRKNCTENDGTMTVNAHTIVWVESGCTIVAPVHSTTGWRGKFTCRGEGMRWDSVIELQLAGSRLLSHTISVTNERNE